MALDGSCAGMYRWPPSCAQSSSSTRQPSTSTAPWSSSAPPHAGLARQLSGQSFGVEVDALPRGFVCSGPFKGKQGTGVVKPVITAGGRLSELFNRHQRGFYAEHAPERVGLDDLSILGPVLVLKLN